MKNLLLPWLITSLSCLLFPLEVFSQGAELPQIIPPGPTAASLGEYGDVSPNFYTGVPGISIPLCQIQSRDINVPISLSYHAGGIKVEEEASWVGLGWSLIAGGTVTRTIRGLDDLGQAGYQQQYTNMPPSDANNNYDIDNSTSSDQTYFENLCNQQYDGEPDIFYFNFNGFSGKFVLADGGAEGQLLSQDSRVKIRYIYTSPTPPSNYSPVGWEATTPDGFVYIFEEQEITKSFSGSGNSEAQASNVFSNPLQEYTTNTWYLSKIVSPLGEEVTFTYETNLHATSSLLSFTETQDEIVRAQLYCTTPCSGPLACSLENPCVSGAQTPYYASRRTVYDVYLERIDYTNGYVLFSTSDRIDMLKDPSESNASNPQKLDKMEVFVMQTGSSQAEKVKSIDFTYSYFNGPNTFEAEKRLRLRLDKIQESNGSESIPEHEFEYFLSGGLTELPYKDSKSQDHWGYNNGANNENITYWAKFPEDYDNSYLLNSTIPKTALFKTGNPLPVTGVGTIYCHLGWDNTDALLYCLPNSQQYDPVQCYNSWDNLYPPTYFNGAEREVNSTEILAGTLKKITYPTGGHLAMEYEPHDYSNFAAEDIWTEQPEAVAISCGPQADTGTFFECNTGSSSVNFTLHSPTFIFLTHQITRNCAITNPTGCDASFDSQVAVSYASLSEATQGPVPLNLTYANLVNHPNNNGAFLANTVHFLAAGDYTLSANGILDAFVKMTVKFETPGANPQPLLKKLAGGLRVKTITSHDGISIQNDMVQSFEYTKDNGSGQTISSGKLMSPLQFSYFNYTAGGTSNPGASNAICQSFVRSSTSKYPLGSSAQGASVGYDQVTHILGQNAEGGKTVYQYFNTEEEVSEPFFPDMPNRMYNSNGLLGMVSHYKKNPDGSFQIISQTENEYNGKKFNDTDLKDPNPGFNTVVIKAVKLYNAECNGTLDHFAGRAKFYDTVSEWWKMTKSTQKAYDQNNPSSFVETTTDYTYHSFPIYPTEAEAGYLRSQSVSNSDGSISTTEYAYAEDFTVPSGNPIDKMQDDRIINVPIEVLQKIDGEVVSGVFTEFKIVDNHIVQGKTHILETASPIANFSSTRSSHIPGAPYQERVDFSSYDDHGNLLSVKMTGGPATSYIWGHDDALPIAKVSNANEGSIAYTGFDYPAILDPVSGNNKDGNWEFSGSGGYETLGNGKVGLGRYDLNNSRSLSTEVSDGGNYILSFWATKDLNAYSFPGQSYTTIVNGYQSNGWRYYELKFTLSANSTLTISGNSSGFGWIDELRLYPEGAQMSTYSYDKLLRLHTECDPNSRPLFYHYDDLGRLTKIVDHEGKLRSLNTYHYANSN
ncbi:MAG: RHS repeat domain-containing protein [Bacteroidota bacterium]